MPPRYNRVRVEDLINETPAQGESSTDNPSQSQPTPAVKCEVPLCGRKFVSEEALQAHHKRSHAEPTAYVCQKCKSSFSTIPNLNKHMRTVHEKLKPFKCDLCPSTFAFRDGLFRHTRMVHDQVRPFACPHCSLKFKTKSHMSKHSLSLHPEKHQVVQAQGSSSTDKKK